MKKKILVFAVIVMAIMCLFAISISAAETINGISYDLSNGVAKVNNGNKSYSSEIVIIPETVTGADGKEYTVKEINQEAFLDNKNIKYVSLPATITKLGPSAFRGCSNLNFVDFNDNQNDVDFNNWGHFKDCTSLKAVSMPDNVDLITNRMFSGCTNLKAVYLPSATKNIESNGYSPNGAFSKCNNMYFVNEPFDVRDENGNFYGDNFVMPTKPEVYFFPSGLEKIYERDSGVGFEGCYNLNPVMVFPETLTKFWINDGVFYECGKTGNNFTVVFLGNMTDVRIGMRESRATGISYVFANPADKTLNDVNIIDTSPSYTPTLNGTEHIYFCHSNKYFKLFNLGGNNDASTYTESNVTYLTGVPHVANPDLTKVTEATCEEDKGERTYCFCGAEIGFSPVEGTALGHEHDVEKGATKVSVVYNGDKGYLDIGKLSIKCARCENVKETDVNPIISDFKGFSASEEGDGVTFGYVIDYDALNEYVKLNGKNVELGFVVALQSTSNDDAPELSAATSITAKVVTWTTDDEANLSAVKYTGADFIIRGDWTGNENTVFCMAGYLKDGEDVSYLNSESSGEKADTFYYAQFCA